MKNKKRDKHGRFIKASASKKSAPKRSAHKASESKKSHKKPHHTKGHHPKKSTTHKASAPKGSASKKSAPRRPPQVTNVAIVPVGGKAMAPHGKKRKYRAREMGKRARFAGGMAIFVPSALIGLEVADDVHRAIVTVDPANPAKDAKLPTGIADWNAYNAAAVVARPSVASVLAQLGVSLVGWILGAVVPWLPAKAIAYGFATGALLNPLGQLASAWIIQPIAKKFDWGKRIYSQQLAANDALYPSTTGNMSRTRAATLFGGTMGAAPAPQMDAAPSPRQLPLAQPQRMPDALFSLGCPTPETAPAPTSTASRDQPPPVRNAPAIDCAPPAFEPQGPSIGAPPAAAAKREEAPTYRRGGITSVMLNASRDEIAA